MAVAFGRQVFDTRDFPNQILRFVDQDGQVLGADPGDPVFEIKGHQRDFVTRATAVGASRGLVAHVLPQVQNL